MLGKSCRGKSKGTANRKEIEVEKELLNPKGRPNNILTHITRINSLTNCIVWTGVSAGTVFAPYLDVDGPSRVN